MPDDANQPAPEPHLSPVRWEFLPFKRGVESLLVIQPDDRPLDQYLSFKDRILELLRGQKFLDELSQESTRLLNLPSSENGDALRTLALELKAFTNALQVAQNTEKKDVLESKEWRSRWLSRASTTVGSMKDVLEQLPWYGKTCLTLFKELIDIFRAKG